MSTHPDGKRRRTGGWLLAAAALAGGADYLFYGQPVGWTLGAFGGVVLAMLAVRERAAWGKAGLVAAAATVGMLGALVIEPTAVGVGMTLLGLVTLAVGSRCGWAAPAGAWLERWGEWLLLGWLQALWDAHAARRYRRGHRAAGARSGRWAGRWVGPVGLSVGFGVLFAIANPVITRWLERAGEKVRQVAENLGQYLAPARVLLWLAVGAGAWALWRWRGPRRRSRKPRTWVGAVLANIRSDWQPLSAAGAPRGAAESVEAAGAEALAAGKGDRAPRDEAAWVVRCLALFNAVFAVQNGLDAWYLWGGAALPEGMTYAQYAHRGAYPLVATALLAALFALVTLRPGGAGENSAAARRLVYLWLTQNVFLVVSAGWRLGLYVEAYSLTRWRMAALLWMGLVAAGLGWIGWRIMARRSNQWLLGANLVTALVLLYACAWVDFDGAIAGYNVRHCREATGRLEHPRLDVEYMKELGPAALPALAWLKAKLRLEEETDEVSVEPLPPPRLREQARLEAAGGPKVEQALRELRVELRQDLRDWRGWTWRRGQLARKYLDGDEAGSD